MTKNLKHTYSIAFAFLVIFVFLVNTANSQSSFQIFEKNQKYGLKDQNNKITIPARFEKIGWSQGLNISIDNVIGYYDDGWGIISTSDKKLTLPKYYSLEAIHKNLIVASIKGKFSNELFYGVLNSKGEVIIDFKYHSIVPLKELFIVSERRNGVTYYGLMSQQSKLFLPINHINISFYHSDLFIFTDPNNKKGIIHKNGLILTEPTLDSIGNLRNNFSLVYQSGGVGAIDTSGRYIHRPFYKSILKNLEVIQFQKFQFRSKRDSLIKKMYCDSILELSNELLAVFRNGNTEIMDKNFILIYEAENLNDLTAFKKSIIFRKENKYHLIKSSGEIIESEGFDTLLFDQNYVYGSINGNWQLFNGYGTNLSKWKLDSVITGSHKLLPIKKNGYWGYMDHAGKIAISIKYNSAGKFTDNIDAVNYLGSNYIINQFGEILDAHSYDDIKIEQSNIALVTEYGRTDIIDNQGNTLFQTFNVLVSHPFGYLEKTENGTVGLISHFGEVILEPTYDIISEPISKRYLRVKKSGQVGLINFKGIWLVPLTDKYEDIDNVGDNLIGVKKNGQYGFIDFKGSLLIANRYDGIRAFSNQMAPVKLNGKWGFINPKEELIIQPTFEKVFPFNNGIALVKRGGKSGAIDKTGKSIINIDYDNISISKHGFLLAQKANRFGLYDHTGNLLLKDAYTKIFPTNNGEFIVQRRDLMGLLDASARYTIPLKYRSIKEMSNGLFLCILPVDQSGF